MPRKAIAEPISCERVKRVLQRAFKDASKITNLPPLPTRRTVTQVRIQNCDTTQSRNKIRVKGKGWIDLDFVYGNAEMGEIEVMEDFRMTYSAEFANDKTLLDCKARILKRQ